MKRTLHVICLSFDPFKGCRVHILIFGGDCDLRLRAGDSEIWMLKDQSLAFFSCDLSKILGVWLGKFLYLSQEENGLPPELAFHKSWSIRGEHLPSEVVTYIRRWVCVFARVMNRTCPMDSHSLSRQAGLEALTLRDMWISSAWVPLEGFWIQWRLWCLSPHITGRGAQTQASTCDPHVLSPGWLCSEHVCFIYSLCHVMCGLTVMFLALLSNLPFKILSKIRCSGHFFTARARSVDFPGRGNPDLWDWREDSQHKVLFMQSGEPRFAIPRTQVKPNAVVHIYNPSVPVARQETETGLVLGNFCPSTHTTLAGTCV